MQIKQTLHYSTPVHTHYISWEKNESVNRVNSNLDSRRYVLSIPLINFCGTSDIDQSWYLRYIVHSLSSTVIFPKLTQVWRRSRCIRSGADLRVCCFLCFNRFDHKIIRTGRVQSLKLIWSKMTYIDKDIYSRAPLSCVDIAMILVFSLRQTIRRSLYIFLIWRIENCRTKL
jgi:hypothetical protein